MKRIIAFLFAVCMVAQLSALEGRFKLGSHLEYSSINTPGIEKGLSLYKRKQVIFFRNDSAFVVAVSSNSNLSPFWVATELEELPVDDQFAYDDYRDEIIFSSVGKLFQSFWKDNQWTYQKRVRMEGINEKLPKDFDLSKGDPKLIKKIYHPTFAKNGDRMYFAAQIKGETNLDLWYSDRGRNDIWKAPVKLTVNTDANEEHPFVVGDSLLYFASNRAENSRSNLYYIDLREQNPVARISVLSQPNSDEIGMVCVGSRVHVISDRCSYNPRMTCDDNIFKADLPEKVMRERAITFSEIEEIKPKSDFKSYPIVFQEMEDKVIVEPDSASKDSLFDSYVADMEKNVEAEKVTGHVYKIADKVIFYFDLNDDQLKQLYDDDLDALIDLIKQNPNKKFLISGFTDVRGTDAYNESLSLRRAKTVVDRIAERGGIKKSRLLYTGFGKRKSGLAIKNAVSEEEHQKNRRVEVKVIK